AARAEEPSRDGGAGGGERFSGRMSLAPTRHEGDDVPEVSPAGTELLGQGWRPQHGQDKGGEDQPAAAARRRGRRAGRGASRPHQRRPAALAADAPEQEDDARGVDEGGGEEDPREAVPTQHVQGDARVEVRGPGMMEAEARIRSEELTSLGGQPRVELEGGIVARGGQVGFEAPARDRRSEQQERRG